MLLEEELIWTVGGFTSGFKDNVLYQPGGLILQSVSNGYPVMAVEINYRLGGKKMLFVFPIHTKLTSVFGFAQSAALRQAGSENAALRDQRLALDWVSENIAAFGGDPSRITIHGQSSGGLAVGMQIMAFGATRSYPFQQAICESQALEPGITGNFTREAMAAVWKATGCNNTGIDSEATVECLRKLPMQELLKAQLDTASSANVGDIWLPVVDGVGGFLPAAPSTLIAEHRFGNISTMMGWCDDDALLFTPPSIKTPNDTYTFISQYLPEMTETHVRELLSLYPPSDFTASHDPNGRVELAAEVYRCGRIFRDILFTCQPLLYGKALREAGNEVYFYDQNQTMFSPILEHFGLYDEGVVHTSELLYVFGNLSKFDIPGLPYNPSAEDFLLRDQESRSWATFAALGHPSLEGHNTLPGWLPAEFSDDNYGVYVIGGPKKGCSGTSGSNSWARKAITEEKLKVRCGFLNSPDIVREIRY